MRRQPVDDRPKWNDPHLLPALSLEQLEAIDERMKGFDRLPPSARWVANYAPTHEPI